MLIISCLRSSLPAAELSTQERFDQIIFPVVEKAIQQPATEQGGEIAWGESYQLSALVEMLAATRDPKYAALIVPLCDWIAKSRDNGQNLRDEFRNQVLPAWSSTNYSKAKRYTWAVHTGMIAAPMAKFAAVVASDRKLRAKWGNDAKRIVRLAEEAVAVHDADYREGPGATEGHLHCLFLEKHLPLNMQNALARAWLAIDDATGKPQHRERITRLAQFFKNRLRLMGDQSAAWAYWPPLENAGDSFEDVSHASINVDFMVQCYEHGIVFTREDLEHVKRTLLSRVLLADNRVSNTVGGGDKFDSYRHAPLRWGRLGRHFPDVRERLLAFSQLPDLTHESTALPLGLALLNLPPAKSKPSPAPAPRAAAKPQPKLYTYTLLHDGSREAYDESLAVACLQGIINRKSPQLYVLSRKNTRPQYWLDIMRKDGRWLEGREQVPLTNLDALIKLAGKRIKGAVIWDPNVPASVNVATTVAGVEDGVVLSPEYAERFLKAWGLPVLTDLRGRFTGAETGSKKNDAYRWAIREYLAKGRCSSKLLCLFEDSFTARAAGDIGYVLTRDWAVRNRAFVFDLSPWGDEKPKDDPGQKLGLDLETYHLMLSETLRHSAGKHMTELTGFFAFSKYANMPDHKSTHEPVPTEWESVWLMSPYNCYQNTISSDCFNQSLHSQAPRAPLKQDRTAKKVTLENKAYICILMADYDSATPLYEFLPNHWHNAARGKIPFAWGINPNLLETYPDIISYFYSTASAADTFTADASAAGYMNPNRVRPEYLPLFVQHNRRFFREADMDIAPMVLDWDEPSAAVKDAFGKFSPNGFATIVMDLHGKGGKSPAPHVWKGMPVMELLNDTCNFASAEQTASAMSNAIKNRGNKTPGFYFFRIVWVNPKNISDTLEALRKKRPDLNFEVLDPHTFCALFKESQARRK